MKPNAELVHYAAPGATRVDANANVLAPCDAIVGVHSMGEFQQQRSTTLLKHVTCPVCRERIAAVGREYCKARRVKEISW